MRHRPRQASGGRITDQDLGAFLVQGGMGPKKKELLRLIGELVGQSGDAEGDPVVFYP